MVDKTGETPISRTILTFLPDVESPHIGAFQIARLDYKQEKLELVGLHYAGISPVVKVKYKINLLTYWTLPTDVKD